eukprot:SAG31_NODE_30137_length_385_cov_0.541958_1_plen_97_part_01
MTAVEAAKVEGTGIQLLRLHGLPAVKLQPLPLWTWMAASTMPKKPAKATALVAHRRGNTSTFQTRCRRAGLAAAESYQLASFGYRSCSCGVAKRAVV